MLEIVFSESACGGLRWASSYGRGPYPAGAAVQLFAGDGAASPQELEEALRQAEAARRQDWESAVPLEIRPQDVYCFDLTLSVGDISDNGLGPRREAALAELYAVWEPETARQRAMEQLHAAGAARAAVTAAYEAGESLRIWYSRQSDELCGLYWLLAQLRPRSESSIYLVELQETGRAWGEAAPSAWGRHLFRQQEASPALLSDCAKTWQQLQAENAPLRAAVNGRPASAEAALYDPDILRALARQPDRFSMSTLIAEVLNAQPNTSDAWLTLRLERMIEQGMLEPLEKIPEDAPRYRRKLRKNAPQEDT